MTLFFCRFVDGSATFKLEPNINIEKKAMYYVHPYRDSEWSLGYVHYPPYYVRAMFNNNTAEYDRDVAWILKYDKEKEKEKVPLGKHRDLFQALIKLLELIHGPLTSSQVQAINNALHGSLDLKVMGNSSAIMDLLKSRQNSLLLSQLALMNNIDFNIMNKNKDNKNSQQTIQSDAQTQNVGSQGSAQGQKVSTKGNAKLFTSFSLHFNKIYLINTLNTYRTAVSPTLDLLCHEDFNVGRSEADYTGTKISRQQSPNSSMEIIFILSGKYKIFMFAYSVSARVIRHLQIRWFTSCTNRWSRYSFNPIKVT